MPDSPTLREQITEVQRELALRRHAYPRFIARKTLKPAEAERYIARMEAALLTLTRLHQQETAAATAASRPGELALIAPGGAG